MVNFVYLYGAYAIISIILGREIIKKFFNVDINEITLKDVVRAFNNDRPLISRNTGNKSLRIVNAGNNKATVVATLRHITGIDTKSAKTIVNKAPMVFMSGISYQDADMTKKALECVGASVEIK